MAGGPPRERPAEEGLRSSGKEHRARVHGTSADGWLDERLELFDHLPGRDGADRTEVKIVAKAHDLQSPVAPGVDHVETPGTRNLEDAPRVGIRHKNAPLSMADALMKELERGDHLRWPWRADDQIGATTQQPAFPGIERLDT
jgi:hypothetical protein